MVGDRARHPLFARAYALAGGWLDRAGATAHRRRLLAGLSGRVIEVGAGDGRSFAHYPPRVTGVVAVEPEPRLRAAAVLAAATAPVPVAVVGGVADALGAADGAFDAAVSSLVLCSVPDPALALAAISAAGFDLEHVDRFRFPRTALAQVAASHVLGAAVRR